jgi:hypothetical protein
MVVVACMPDSKHTAYGGHLARSKAVIGHIELLKAAIVPRALRTRLPFKPWLGTYTCAVSTTLEFRPIGTIGAITHS